MLRALMTGFVRWVVGVDREIPGLALAVAKAVIRGNGGSNAHGNRVHVHRARQAERRVEGVRAQGTGNIAVRRCSGAHTRCLILVGTHRAGGGACRVLVLACSALLTGP